MYRKNRSGTNASSRLRLRVASARPPTEHLKKERTAYLSKIDEFGSTLRNVVVNLALITITILAAVTLFWEVRKSATIIGTIQVPEALVKLGISPEVASRRLLAQLRLIQQNAKTKMKSRVLRGAETQTDFQMQVAGFEFRQLLKILKRVFNLEDTQVLGEIIQTADGFEFRAFIIEPNGLSTEIRPIVADQNLDSLFISASEEIQGALSPYILASHFATVAEKNCKGDTHCDYSRAQSIYRSILSSARAKEYQWAYLGWSYTVHSLRRYEEAAEMAELAAQVSGPFSEGYNSWGASLVVMGRYEEAIDKFKVALQIEPNEPMTLYNWGDALSKKRAWAQADDAYAKATRQDTLQGEAFVRWGNSLRGRNRLKEAIEKYRLAVSVEPGHPTAGVLLALSLADIGNFRDANLMFKRFTLKSPDDPWEQAMWAKAMLREKRWTEGFQKLESVVGLLPDEAWPRKILADELIKYGEKDRGMTVYKSAAALPLKGKAALYNSWGRQLYNLKLFKEAIPAFEQATAEESSNAVYWVDLGDALGEDAADQKAIETYQHALHISPKLAEAHKGLGITEIRRGHWQAAITSLKEAADLDPNDPETKQFWGQALQRNGQLDDALTMYKNALDLDPAYFKAMLGIGDVYWEKGNKELASTAYGKGIPLMDDVKKRRLACQRLSPSAKKALTEWCAP